MSVAELKARARQLRVEIPPDLVEKGELVALIEKAEQEQQRALEQTGQSTTWPVSPSPSSWGGAPSPSGGSSKGSVAQLKSRLRELGFEVPTCILEKAELVSLVEEAERQHARKESAAAAGAPSLAAARNEAATAAAQAAALHVAHGGNIPAPWYMKESRSKPGKYYYVNAETGVTTWHLPGAQVDASAAEPEPTGAEERGRHDYRDNAFPPDLGDDEADPGTARVGSTERPWSRSATIFSAKGESGGVTQLIVAAASVDSISGTIASGGTVATDGTVAATLVDAGTVDGASLVANAPDLVRGEQRTWLRGDMLGRGALGRVYWGRDEATGQVMAVKEISINSNDADEKEYMETLENEVGIMKGLQHPNIVAYLGHDYFDGCLYIYLEHMPGGTLTQVLQQFGAFDESLLSKYSKQLLEGLEHMHTRSPPILHRDLKGSNILLGADSRAKLADFGCSKRTQQTMTHTLKGSIPWMAPEVIAHSRYGRGADIWSFGCVVIEMGTAQVPWGRFDNQMQALVRIGLSEETPPLPKGISETLADFITQCVVRDMERRPSTTELLNHPLLRDLLD